MSLKRQNLILINEWIEELTLIAAFPTFVVASEHARVKKHCFFIFDHFPGICMYRIRVT